jgi:bifunctional non-homologous end joining protein LigD
LELNGHEVTVSNPDKVFDESAGNLDSLLALAFEDEHKGLGDAPWPPHFPKAPGEPKRVQPSKAKPPE